MNSFMAVNTETATKFDSFVRQNMVLICTFLEKNNHSLSACSHKRILIVSVMSDSSSTYPFTHTDTHIFAPVCVKCEAQAAKNQMLRWCRQINVS